MNKLFDTKVGMYKIAHAFLGANTATITAAGSSILNTYTGDLETLIDAISNTSEQTAVDTKSITEVKREARKDTTDRAVQIAGAVFSYATDLFQEAADLKWSQLAAQMEVMTAGFFEAQKDEEVSSSFYNIVTIASELESASPQPSTTLLLKDYGIKVDVTTPTTIPGTLTLFDQSITVYTNLSTKPREAISTQKTNNQKLERLYDTTDRLLEKADKVVVGLKQSYPDFFAGWQNARMLVGPLRLRTQVAGIVSKVTDVNLGTTAVAEDAKITMTAEPYTKVKNKQTIQVKPKPVILQTDATGKYAVPTPDNKPMYTLSCTLPGYQDIIKTGLKVRRSKKLTVDFLLLPVQQ